MIEKLTKDFICKLIIEINKPDNQFELETKLFNPILSNFANRIYPYVSLLFIIYSLNLILIITILILIIMYNKKE